MPLRTAPVPSSVTVIWTPETAAPVASEMVPEIVPVACPYINGQQPKSNENTMTARKTLPASMNAPSHGHLRSELQSKLPRHNTAIVGIAYYPLISASLSIV